MGMVSITAQVLLAWRRVESWWLGIFVDLIAVPLFAWRGLYATSAVYVVLLGLSIDGLIQWRRAAAAGTAPACPVKSPFTAPKAPENRRWPRVPPPVPAAWSCPHMAAPIPRHPPPKSPSRALRTQ